MITLLENVLERSDGSYISPEDLQSLDAAFDSWKLRRQTYDSIQAQEEAIVTKVLTYLGKITPNFKRRYTDDNFDRCRRDVTLVLRYSATAMLLQDEELLKDRLLYWMQNILRALRVQTFCDRTYRFLQQAVKETLPVENADLILPYLAIAHQWLSQ